MLLRIASVVAVLVLSVPAFGITVLSPDDPALQGTTMASESFTVDTRAGGEPVPPPVPVFFVDEKVVQNGAATLDFYFKLRNVSDPQTLSFFALSFPNSIQASTFYFGEGNLAPTGGSVTSFGNQAFAVYSFGNAQEIVGPLIGSGGTDTLVLRTNANAYTSGTVEATRSSFDDFEIRPGTGLVPSVSSVPEPAPLALLSFATVALAIKLRRRVPCFWRRP